MKKFALFLALVMLACALPLAANAAEPSLAVTSATAKAGEEITVTVSIKDNPGIVGAQIYLSYNSKIMSFVSATAKDSRFATTFSPEQGANPVKIIMANLSFAEVSGDITAAEVKFKMADMADAGTHDISVSMVEAYDKSLTAVAFASGTGTVKVTATPSSSGGGSSHRHSYTRTVVPPTATEEGYTLNTCACGYSYKSDFTYGESVTKPEPPKTEIKLTIGSNTAYVNGKAELLDVLPVIIADRTLLPVRFISETLGAKVDWDAKTSTATITSGETVIQLTIGSITAYINGKTELLDAAPIIMSNRTLLPVRFIAEAIGAKVDWDAPTATATITK